MKMFMNLSMARFALSAVAGTLLFSGCNRQQATSYTVPKENPSTMPAPGPATMADASAGPRPSIRWSELPNGWKETAGSAMRAASFSIQGSGEQTAEVSVTPLAAGPGMESGSINMWRGELGLSELPADEVAKAGETVPIGSAEGKLYDLSGTLNGKPTRIVGAVLNQSGTAWFFKMRGSDELVAAQKPAFAAFLKQVEFAQASAAPTALAAATPAAAPASAPATPSPSTTGGGTAHIKPPDGIAAWQVPAHWQAAPLKTMLLAVMTVPGGGEVTISSFPGDVGGLRANVDRWRRQIGLGPTTDDELGKTTTAAQMGGVTGTIVDVRNAAADKGTLAVILPHAGSSWFLKLSGPNAVVEKEKQDFIKFAESVRFP